MRTLEKTRRTNYRRATGCSGSSLDCPATCFSNYVARRVSTRVLTSLSLPLSSSPSVLEPYVGLSSVCFKFHTSKGSPHDVYTQACSRYKTNAFDAQHKEAYSRRVPFLSMSHPRYALLLLCHSGRSSSTTLLRGPGPRCHHGAVCGGILRSWQQHQQPVCRATPLAVK